MIERREAEAILRTLRSEWGEARDTVSRAQVRMSALGKLIEGYMELFPGIVTEGTATAQPAPSAAMTDSSRPRGQEAVLAVMKESIGKWFTVTSITKELQKRGLAPDTDTPGNAIRASLDRLATSPGTNVQKDRGSTGTVTYSYRPFVPPPQQLADRVEEEQTA